MGVNKFGSSQQMRDGVNSIYLDDDVPEFTSDELEIMEKINQLCIEKGIDQDVLIEKLFRYKK